MNTGPKTVRLPHRLDRQLRQPMTENDTPTLSAEVVRQLTASAAQPRIDGDDYRHPSGKMLHVI